MLNDKCYKKTDQPTVNIHKTHKEPKHHKRKPAETVNRRIRLAKTSCIETIRYSKNFSKTIFNILKNKG